MNLNGTGPQGQGPMTGRGMGYCGNGQTYGRGVGRGMGRGFGRGLGFGRPARQSLGVGGGYDYRQPTKSEETTDTKAYIQDLEAELKDVKGYLKELQIKK